MPRVHRLVTAMLITVVHLAFSGCHPNPRKQVGPVHEIRSNEASDYTLSITFYGLVAFVPITTADNKKQVWALLPSADDPELKNLPFGAHPPDRRIPLHQPFIKIAAKYLGATGLNPDTPIFLSLRSASALLPTSDLRDYHGHDIKFDQEFNGDQVDPLDLNYVPDLSDPDIATNDPHPRICSQCLDTANPPPTEIVAARILLTKGSLKSGPFLQSPVAFGYYNSRQFILKPKKSYPKMAEAVTATMTYPAAPLQLILVSYTPGQDPQPFVLTPPNAESQIYIEVVNLPGDEVANRVEAPRTGYWDRFVSDHYALYYLLSQGKDNPPYLMPQAPSHGGQPYCGVVQFIP